MVSENFIFDSTGVKPHYCIRHFPELNDVAALLRKFVKYLLYFVPYEFLAVILGIIYECI